ncbi:MAG: hypothetical protein KDB03_26950 [Planctomycetales bacterium]|nr:hypothetical protein [Planctomycetales bacterium]
MIWPFRKKTPNAIEPSDRWYVEIDDRPVAIIDNPVDAEMFWFKWQLHSLDGADTPTDLWDYSMDARRSFRHVEINERNRCTSPAGKGAVLPDGRVLLRGPLKGRDYCECGTGDEPDDTRAAGRVRFQWLISWRPPRDRCPYVHKRRSSSLVEYGPRHRRTRDGS